MSILQTAEYVSAGSRMQWTGQFPNLVDVIANRGPAGIVGFIASNLLNKYNLVVERYDNSLGTTGLAAGSITLYLRTDSDRGNGETDDGLSDILKNVDDEFANDGHVVSSSSLNNYTPAPSQDNTAPATINTGSPQQTAAQENAQRLANTGTLGTGTGIGGWFTGIVGQVEAGSIGVVIGAVLVVGVLVYLTVKP